MEKYPHILKAISSTMPYTYEVVEHIFDATLSYDKTLFILDTAIKGMLSPAYVLRRVQNDAQLNSIPGDLLADLQKLGKDLNIFQNTRQA
ncbi:MAG TPA: hypothetical protein VHK91_05320 [Flavisolibacter sp.]|jgi:hypothetical protein|nr:hypothetical protein [Flavisolibacter sp.]